MAKINLNEIVPKTCGVKGAAIAFVQEETVKGISYEIPEYFTRVRKATITPQCADNELDSNDSVEEEGNEIVGYEVSIDASGIKPETEAKMYGHKIDKNGGIIEKEGDTPPKLALLLELAMSGNQSKYVALYCGAAQQHTDEAETKTSNSITRSLPTVNFKFGRALNGLIKYSVRTDAKNYNPEIGKKWFEAVQFPADVTAEADEGEDSNA